MSKLITKNEIKELSELVDCIEDDRTQELIRKLHGSYNLVYIKWKEEFAKNKRADLIEVKYQELKRKYEDKEKKTQKLTLKNKEEIENSLENYKKWKEAETKIEILEKKLEKLGGTNEDTCDRPTVI